MENEVYPERIEIQDFKDGGCLVTALYDFEPLFQRAFAGREEARATAAELVWRRFPKPQEEVASGIPM